MLHDISFPVWRRLFSLGLDFKELKPWEWMGEGVMFGVVQPENGEIGYCVMLGNSHPIQGLAVFKGDKGLFHHLYHWKHKQEIDLTNCMVLSFAQLDSFWKEEKELFEWLEIGDQDSYPLIRDHETGMENWPLEDEEKARLMMFAIEQSISMAIRFKQERILSSPSDLENLRIMLRAPYRKGAILLWKDQWKEIELANDIGTAARANKLFLRSNCRDLPIKSGKKWVLEIFSFPDLRRPPGQRPYYPYGLLLADSEAKTIIGEFLFKPTDLHEQLQIRIKDILVSEGYKPGEFSIVGEDSFNLLAAITQELGIKTSKRKKTPAYLTEMKEKLINS